MTAVTLAAKLSSSNESTWMRLGALSELMHDTEKALYCYENAIRHSPYNIKALTQAASICRMREQYPKAVEYFLRILNVEDTNGEIWGAVGHCYLMMDDLQNAYTAYQKALYHLPNPKDPNLWYGIGILYDRYGSFDHAEEAFTAVLKMDSKFEKANEIYFRLGIIYKQQMKHEQSLDCFRYILQKPPRPLVQADIWFQIGHVHELQKDFQLAKDAYERVLKENPSHAKVLQQLGWLYHHNTSFGNQDTAISYLMRSIDSDPSDGQTWYLLGRCYMAQQKFRKAYDAYQQAVYRDGRNPTFWCSIGVLYYQINQYRDALDAYSRAIRLNPYLSEVWYDLGTLYESCNNQISDALDAYQRAAELDPHNKHIQQRLSMLRAQLPGAGGKAAGKEFGDDENQEKSAPRTMEPRPAPIDGGMGLPRGRRPPNGLPNSLDFQGGDDNKGPNMPAKLPDIMDITEDRQNSLPSATELDSSLNESKNASRSAQDNPEERKRLRGSIERMEDSGSLIHKLEPLSHGNSNGNGNGAPKVEKEKEKENKEREKEKEQDKEKEKEKDTKERDKEEKDKEPKEKDKEKDKVKEEKDKEPKDMKEKEKEKEKPENTKDMQDDYYDRDSPSDADKPQTKEDETAKPPKPSEALAEKEANGRAEDAEKEGEVSSKRGLDDISSSASKRAKRSPTQENKPSSPSSSTNNASPTSSPSLTSSPSQNSYNNKEKDNKDKEKDTNTTTKEKESGTSTNGSRSKEAEEDAAMDEK